MAHVLPDAEPGAIVTDCHGIKKRHVATQRGQVPKGTVLKGANADLWWQVWQVLRRAPGWTFEWLPSHRSQAEAMAAGLPQEDWLGSEQADEATQAQARVVDISPLLESKWTENQPAVETVWKLGAESQVSHLAGRPRRVDGSAAKARKRQAPARPGRATRRQMQERRSGKQLQAAWCRFRSWMAGDRRSERHEAGGRAHPADGLRQVGGRSNAVAVVLHPSRAADPEQLKAVRVAPHPAWRAW